MPVTERDIGSTDITYDCLAGTDRSEEWAFNGSRFEVTGRLFFQIEPDDGTASGTVILTMDSEWEQAAVEALLHELREAVGTRQMRSGWDEADAMRFDVIQGDLIRTGIRV